MMKLTQWGPISPTSAADLAGWRMASLLPLWTKLLERAQVMWERLPLEPIPIVNFQFIVNQILALLVLLILWSFPIIPRFTLGHSYFWHVWGTLIHWTRACRGFVEHSGSLMIIRLPINSFVYQWCNFTWRASMRTCQRANVARSSLSLSFASRKSRNSIWLLNLRSINIM